jgi:hypothetical protein
VADPLFLENTVTVPRINHADQDGVQAEPKPLYLNFQELEKHVGKWSTQRWIRLISSWHFELGLWQFGHQHPHTQQHPE